MDLINLALQFKDYEWVKELVELENNVEVPNTAVEERARDDLFSEKSLALENITNTYAVREKSGIRAFNINSEFDRNLSDLVMVERPSYKKGEIVKFRTPSNEEIIFARGIVNGYILGYGEANNNFNKQLMQYFNAIEPQDSKKQAAIGTSPKKVTRPRKTRKPKQ